MPLVIQQPPDQVKVCHRFSSINCTALFAAFVGIAGIDGIDIYHADVLAENLFIGE
jgi:hypothetical protein